MHIVRRVYSGISARADWIADICSRWSIIKHFIKMFVCS